MSAPSVAQLLVSHWQAAWPLDAVTFVLAAVYGRAASRINGSWPVLRSVSFFAGLGCILVALQSGVGAYDDRLLSVHMVQHMLLLMAAPLLLLAGRPVILVLRSLPRGPRAQLARALSRTRSLTRPLVCLAIFYAVVLLTHLPSFYDATLSHPALHEAEHVMYLAAGTLLWWPILDPDPATARRLQGLGKLAYIIATMPPMALIGAYLNRQPTLVYTPYGPPAHALGISAVTDQQQAGAIMWVAGTVIMTAVGLWAAVSALVAEERRQAARDGRAGPPAPGEQCPAPAANPIPPAGVRL